MEKLEEAVILCLIDSGMSIIKLCGFFRECMVQI